MILKSNRAFSLAELLIAFALLGVVAGLAIAGYSRAINRTQERVAISNLIAIRSAAKVYLANSGGNLGTWNDLNTINTNLSLHLTADPVYTYNCAPAIGGDTNVCRAAHSAGWVLHFHMDTLNDKAIHCLPGPACPSCPVVGLGGCG